MNAKTMEGLIGAGKNIDLVNTPMRVFKEARRKEDTATMERAMGYANEFTVKAETYKAQADEGTREDARDAREDAKQELEKKIEKRREEREELAESIEANRAEHTAGNETDSKNAIPAEDIAATVEISEAGRALLEEKKVLEESPAL